MMFLIHSSDDRYRACLSERQILELGIMLTVRLSDELTVYRTLPEDDDAIQRLGLRMALKGKT